MNNIVELPTSQEIEEAKETSRTLAKYASQERVKMTITDENGQNEDMILPGHAMEMLLRILTETSQGKAVSIMPINSVLTTQEAANIMNVSRPHVVKLVENQTIPHHMAGSHRRIFLKDVLTFMEENSKAREQALDDMARLSQEMGLY